MNRWTWLRIAFVASVMVGAYWVGANAPPLIAIAAQVTALIVLAANGKPIMRALRAYAQEAPDKGASEVAGPWRSVGLWIFWAGWGAVGIGVWLVLTAMRPDPGPLPPSWVGPFAVVVGFAVAMVGRAVALLRR